MLDREDHSPNFLAEPLTRRERDVLALLAEGLTSPEIAERLTVALSSVRTHIQHLYGKLGVNSKRQAIQRANALGLLKLDPHVAQIIASLAPAQPAVMPAAEPPESPAPVAGAPPFKGLHFFDEDDTHLFFGREALTARLLERLQAGRFLAVVGASGSGKSSLVRAGVLPALRQSASAPTAVHLLTPSAHPLEALAVTLTRDSNHVTATADLLDDFAREPRALHLWARRSLADGQTLLLVVDQFEETFTLCHDEDERRALIDNLMAAVGSPSPERALRSEEGAGGVSILLTLRADFYVQCGQYPELRDWLAARQEYIGPMTADELRAAIEQPAAHGDWMFEPGLVDLLLKDIGDEPGALPLLSHALLETWQRRRGRTLTFGGYTASGGVRGAIAKTADAVYDDLDLAGQAIARNIFLRLTELGEGTQDTRRRAAVSELIPNNQVAAPIESVLKTLADARLITTSEGAVDVAHEALIREWPTLQEWLNENREGLRLHRHLTEAALAWAKLNRDPGELYRGARLTQALEWAEWSTHHDELNSLERDFLLVSQELAEREEGEREAQRQRELQLAEAKAEAERQRAEVERRRAEEQTHASARLRTRNRLITTVGTVALLLAVLAVLFGWQSSQNAALAQANFTRAEAQRLAAQANNSLQVGGDVQLTALLAIRSLNIQHTWEGDNALVTAAMRGFPQQQFTGHTDAVTAVAFSPDGEYVLSGSWDGTARLWDAHTGQELRRFTTVFAVLDVAFSPDGRYVLTGDQGNRAQLWDTQTGEKVGSPLINQFFMVGFLGVAFSPDGQYIATSGLGGVSLWDAQTHKQLRTFSEYAVSVAFSPDSKFIVTTNSNSALQLWPDSRFITTTNSTGTVQVWDLRQTAQEVWRYTGHASLPRKAVFSPDGQYVLTGGFDKTARLLDAQTGGELRIFTGHTGEVYNVAFSPDGKYALTASRDQTARLWDAQTGHLLNIFSGHKDAVYDVAFSRDGKYILTGSWDKTLQLLDVGGELPQFVGHTAGVNSVAFSPDGRHLLTGSWDRTARLWDTQTGQQEQEIPLAEAVYHGVAFSHDGNFMLIGSIDGYVFLRNAQTNQLLHVFRGHVDGVNDVAFSLDGKYVLTGGWDTTARLWDLRQTGEEVLRFAGHSGAVSCVVFSPDEKYVATASFDNTARLWDAQTGAELQRFVSHSEAVSCVVFSPDGKYVATASLDNTARLWNAQTGEELRRFSGHTSSVGSVAFSPDGKYLLTGSLDRTARLWDVQTGEELRRFIGHAGGIEWAVFSPDGKFIVTASEDGTARLWDVDYHTTMQYLCSRLLRDFTAEERTQYSIPANESTCPTP